MMSPAPPLSVLAAYGDECQPRACHYLAGAGGFSGARLWRLETPRGPLILRRWPSEHPTPQRLAFIHAVIAHSVRQGYTELAEPIPTLAGSTWVEDEGHLWELAPWLPGVADYHAAPSRARLEAAMEALARFHLAASTFPRTEASEGTSPGIRERLARLERLSRGEFDDLLEPGHAVSWPTLHALARQLLPLARRLAADHLSTIRSASQVSVPLQPCLRDVWHDHVLFEGPRVSGLIDYGAMRIESVAGDVARLLGSLAGDDAIVWEMGMDAYERCRPLTPVEQYLVAVFDRSTVVWAGVQWLVWVFAESREFENRAEVARRCQHWLDRLHVGDNSTGKSLFRLD